MKLYNLPAAFYGISSSTSCWNHQGRCSHFGLRRVTAVQTKSRQTSVGFQSPSSISQHRRHYHSHRRHLFHFHSDADSTSFHRHSPLRQRRKLLPRTHHHFDPKTAAFSTHTTSSDPEFFPGKKTATAFIADTEMKHQGPAFRMYYNDVYEVKLPPRHRFPMGKYRKVRERVQDLILNLSREEQESVNCEFHVSPLATFDELSTTHDPTYIQRFLRGDQTEQEQRNVGFPWSTEGVERALSSVGGTLAAACFVCEEQRRRIRNSDLSPEYNQSTLPVWAAHIAGGTHHAFHDYGEGFSVFSDMAVAANVVLDRYPDVIKNKVLLIDLDVHQGNGNAVLFQRGNSTNETVIHKKYADRVFTFSMHCSGNYFSPKQDSDLDIELPIGCKDQAYLMTLNHWLKRFRSEHNREGSDHKWDLVIFQAGVDVLEDDRLGRMNLSPEAVGRRNELVYEFARDLNVPLVICMGGGYPKRDDAWKPIIETHANVYFGAHQFLSRTRQS